MTQAVCECAQLGLPGAADPGESARRRPAGEPAGAAAVCGRGGAGDARGGQQQHGAGRAAHRCGTNPLPGAVASFVLLEAARHAKFSSGLQRDILTSN